MAQEVEGSNPSSHPIFFRKKNKEKAADAAVSLLLMVGCGTTGKFVYPDQMSTLVKMSSSSALQKTVAVIPFDDYRGNDNNCWAFLYLVPLVPYGWMDYERPDAASIFVSINKYDVTPQEDLAKAAAISLRHSNIFQDAFFTMGGEKRNADFVLSGRIKIMKYNGKLLTYGVSFLAPALWLIGAPVGTSENQISLELQLKDQKGNVLWDWSMDKSQWIPQWHYARLGHDCKMFAALYQDGMNEAMNSLAERIRKRPDLFK